MATIREPVHTLTAGGRKFQVAMLTPVQLEILRPAVRAMADAMCDREGLMLTGLVFSVVVGAHHPDLAPEDVAFVITRDEAEMLARALAYQYALNRLSEPEGTA